MQIWYSSFFRGEKKLKFCIWLTHQQYQVVSCSFPSSIHEGTILLVSVRFSGTPNTGTPYPYYSHTTPRRIPKDMGIVWVPLTIRGSHVLGSPGVPITLDEHATIPQLPMPNRFSLRPMLFSAINMASRLCNPNKNGGFPWNSYSQETLFRGLRKTTGG